jgi:hypothetical protein
MCASSSGRAASIFSASGAALSEQVADGKINVQSAYALITRYLQMDMPCREIYGEIFFCMICISFFSHNNHK